MKMFLKIGLIVASCVMLLAIIVTGLVLMTEAPEVNKTVTFTDSSVMAEFAQSSSEEDFVEIVEPVNLSESMENPIVDKVVEVVESVWGSLFPKDLIPKSDPESLIFDALEEERLEEEKLCQRISDESSGIGRPVTISANISHFGGSRDRVVTKNEKGSVSRKNLRATDTSKLYTAWPIPEVNENNPESKWALPSVEEYFGKGHPQLKKRIEFANLELPNYYVKISYFHPIEKKWKHVFCEIADRGPSVEFELWRWDMSKGAIKELGLEDKALKPNSPDHTVELTVQLVRKDSVEIQESTDQLTSLSDETKWYGPQGEVTEMETADAQFSKNDAGKKFQLPSWNDSEEEKTALATNH
jgi:hypothetical protein